MITVLKDLLLQLSTVMVASNSFLESILWGEVFWALAPQEREFPHEFESKKIFKIRPLEIYVTGVQSFDHVTRT